MLRLNSKLILELAGYLPRVKCIYVNGSYGVLVRQNKNILFLTRPWNHAFFVKLSGQMNCNPWFLKENSLEKSGADFACSDLKENDIDEIIFCCRLLRILSRGSFNLGV